MSHRTLRIVVCLASAAALVTTPPLSMSMTTRPSASSSLRAVAIPQEELAPPVRKTTLPKPAGGLPLSSRSAVTDDEEAEQKRRARLALAEKPLDVFVVGLSHHNAAVETREKLAIPEAEWADAARDIVQSSKGAVEEAAVLSTCNRFEVYFSARDERAGFAAASQYLQKRSNLPMSTLRESLFMLGYDHAVGHALRVSAGLDSLIVGEGQILSQMKACYGHAVSENGAGGKVTTRLLNAAVAAGKRARDETDIAKGAVSISSAAYELASDVLADGHPKLPNFPSKLSDAKVAIVGAGKMTRLLLIHMASHGVKECLILNRSEKRALEMAEEFKDSHDMDISVLATDGDNAKVIDALADFDVVFTSTSSESYVVQKSDLESIERPLMLVDISVPRNVDPACDELPNVAAYDVDSLKAVVAKNTAKRQREIVEAEKLLLDDRDAFRGWLESLGAVPAIAKLQKKAEDLRLQEMKRANSKLASLSQREIEAVERLSRGIVSKLLHGPMSALRDSPSSKKHDLALAKKRSTPLSMVKNMFNL